MSATRLILAVDTDDPPAAVADLRERALTMTETATVLHDLLDRAEIDIGAVVGVCEQLRDQVLYLDTDDLVEVPA